jgi:predicted nucleotidyltransferase
MDLSDPTRAVIATLDGSVLAVLATAGKPLTVGQVAQEAVRGSEIGIRRSLGRLVEQGIVRATLMGRNQVHELNRDHIAATVAETLAGLRNELWRRLREELMGWQPKPLYSSVFGSAARRDGDERSDIDLLLVHPPVPGEKPARLTPRARSQLADVLGSALLSSPDPGAQQQWEGQVDHVRELVERWTGNSLQVVDLSLYEWLQPAKPHQSLLAEIQRDGLELTKARGLSIWPSAEAADG